MCIYNNSKKRRGGIFVDALFSLLVISVMSIFVFVSIVNIRKIEKKYISRNEYIYLQNLICDEEVINIKKFKGRVSDLDKHIIMKKYGCDIEILRTVIESKYGVVESKLKIKKDGEYDTRKTYAIINTRAEKPLCIKERKHIFKN